MGRKALLMNAACATDVQRAILAYLASHPDAADSAVGIQRWWLPHPLADASSQDVEAVLWKMVADGEMSELHLPDGSVIFAARHGRKD
jgi:hypothetical protein